MSMKVIALTSANEAAMQAVATQLLQSAHAGQLAVSVLLGIKSADQAQAVFNGGGELWRVGEDDATPELDALVDREISDSDASRLATETAQALRRFVTKTTLAGRVAA